MSGSCFLTILTWVLALIDEDSWLQSQLTFTESFSPKLLLTFGQSSKKRNPRLLWCPQLSLPKQYSLCLTVAEYQILYYKHFLIMGPESGKIWWLKRYNVFRRDIIVNGSFCVEGNPSASSMTWTFSYHHMSQYLIRENMWYQRNDNFVPLQLQILTLTIMTAPAMSSLPKIETTDVHRVIDEGKLADSGEQLTLHGNPSAIAKDFSPYMTVLRRHFCCVCNLSAVWSSKALSMTILTYLRPAMNALLGYSSGKPVQDQLTWGFVL